MQILSGVAKNYPESRLTVLAALAKCDSEEIKLMENDYAALVSHLCPQRPGGDLEHYQFAYGINASRAGLSEGFDLVVPIRAVKSG